ncbi:hypothetical protein Tco_0168586 [Tanacetum coccineum]
MLLRKTYGQASWSQMGKIQTEEEAALGRGKRQRKVDSYRESYAPSLWIHLGNVKATPNTTPETKDLHGNRWTFRNLSHYKNKSDSQYEKYEYAL